MKTIFEALFYDYIKEKEENQALKRRETEIEASRRRLSGSLNKKQRIQFLRIVDAKDLAADDRSRKSFDEGFKLGLKVGYEANRTKGEFTEFRRGVSG